MEMQADGDGWPIGRLAEAAGLPVKTIRFYSDAGVLPSTRTSSGHRRYAPSDLARLQLIRSLRALDVDLVTIGRLMADAAGLPEALRGHAKALEVRLRTVQRQLAVARAASDGPTERTLARLHALARIEAAERDRLLRGFWDDVLIAVPAGDAAWFSAWGSPELPADPSGDQLDAWLELAELAANADFLAATAAVAAWFPKHARPDLDPQAWRRQLGRATRLADEAVAAGVGPGDPEAQTAVDAYVRAYADAFAAKEPSATFQGWLARQMDVLSDARADRWWQLVAQVRPPDQAPPRRASSITWLNQALGLRTTRDASPRRAARSGRGTPSGPAPHGPDGEQH